MAKKFDVDAIGNGGDKKIGFLIGQFIDLLIADMRRRYALPKEAGKPPKPQVVKKEVKASHYDVEIKADYREARFIVVLDDEAIDAELEKMKPEGLSWDFLAYVTESPFGIEDIRGDREFRKSASVRLRQSDKISLTLKAGVAYHVFFLLAIENNDMLRLESEAGIMLRLPDAPSFVQIRALRAELTHLIDSAKPADALSNTETKINEIHDRADRLIEIHQKSSMPDVQKEALIEKVLVESAEAINSLRFF